MRVVHTATAENLKEVVGNESISSLWMIGKNSRTGYNYRLIFTDSARLPVPSIRIDSERREDLLKKGSEEKAKAALVDLTQAIRQKTGGYIEVHPLYRGVWGTGKSPLAPEPPYGDNLTMFIHLTNELLVKEGQKKAEAKKQSAVGVVSPAMEFTPGNIASLIKYLQENVGFEDVSISKLYFKEDKRKLP